MSRPEVNHELTTMMVEKGSAGMSQGMAVGGSAPGRRLLGSRLAARVVAAGAAVCAATGVGGVVAAAEAQAAAAWEMRVRAQPTVVAPGGQSSFLLVPYNRGDVATSGPTSVTLTLPAGVTTRLGGLTGTFTTNALTGGGGWSCGVGDLVPGASSITCTRAASVPAKWPTPPLSVYVTAPASAGTVAGSATVSGGGVAAPDSGSTPLVVDTPGGYAERFGIVDGSFLADAFARDGVTVARQAGAVPDEARAAFDFSARRSPLPVPDTFTPDGTVRSVEVDLPRGFVGNPEAVTKCTPQQLNALARNSPGDKCPPSSQVGRIDVTIQNGLSPLPLQLPVYNVEPPRGRLATLGFAFSGAPTYIHAELRPEDYSIRTTVSYINEQAPVFGQTLTLWGVPAAASHNNERCIGIVSAVSGQILSGSSCPAGIVPKPFLSLPTECGVDGLTTVKVESWQNPGAWSPLEQWPTPPAQAIGCDALQFAPSSDLAPTTTAADAATGLDVELAFGQNDNPNTLATAHLKQAKVTLPEGMTINPSAADGLAACGDDQLGLGSDSPNGCPDAAKIGSVSASSPALETPVDGAVYIRSQNSDDPASGEMFRLAIVLEDPDRDLLVKLDGQVRANPQTGRLETTFDDNPQLPVSSIRLRLKDGPRAPLATPSRCGSHTIDTELTSWAGHVVKLADSFTIDCPGIAGFAPGFDAGSVFPTGGSFSPFVARIARDDRQQFLSGVQVDLPDGLLAKLAGVDKCGSAAAEHGGCPASSRIGTATAGAGAGTNPFYVQGGVYLTEGYKGAPYGMAVHVHAKAGPFDLGWVRVRQALHVDRATAKVTVVSDPLPQIVKGVTVRLRTVNVDVDRPDFTINPTSCDEKQIDATLTSIDGAVHKTATRFQVGDCQALPFKPRLGLRLTGRRQRVTGRHPGVRAVVRQSGVGEAGIERARVALPKSLALDPENAQALCEYEDGIKPDLENHCPKGSIVGRARAKTPLLNKVLVGDVYFVKNVKRSKTGNLIRTLPMIVVALRGEIAINLKGVSSTTRNNRLVNTFAQVPDAPITRFNLNIKGGKTGILAVTRTRRAKINLCTKPRSHIANNRMNGHNGKRANYRVRVKTPCGKRAKARQSKAKRA